MNVLIIEPFYTGSHQRWCDEFQAHSQHKIELSKLSGVHWKWRMHGGAVEISTKLNQTKVKYDLILVSDFLDLATFKALYWDAEVAMAIYFHENQITYPWSETDQDVRLKRDNHYGWINYTSALVANRCFFNSRYHMQSFIDSLPQFLNQFPDGVDLNSIQSIAEKSQVLHLGMAMHNLERKVNDVPVILWNHRWEYDKNPEEFFKSLDEVADLPWKLIVVGKSYTTSPPVFKAYEKKFKNRILHWGFVESIETYQKLLAQSDLLLVTSNQDFFGGSVVEAIHAGVFPILPNRLAYSEHLPSSFLYTTEQQMLKQLRDGLNNWKELTSFQSYVEKYEWNNCISNYDSALELLVNQTGSKVVH